MQIAERTEENIPIVSITGDIDLESSPKLRDFLKSVDGQFDVCLIDTHPNPDIRLIAALATGAG